MSNSLLKTSLQLGDSTAAIIEADTRFNMVDQVGLLGTAETVQICVGKWTPSLFFWKTEGLAGSGIRITAAMARKNCGGEVNI